MVDMKIIILPLNHILCYINIEQHVLGCLNWTSSSSPTKLLSQGNLETSPIKMADIQNQYYIEKMKTIRRSFQGQHGDPSETLKNILQGNQSSFSTKEISPDDVDKIIRGLKNSKASGLDNLDTFIVKLTRSAIIPKMIGPLLSCLS